MAGGGEMTIFLVSTGEYSAYQIRGAFSTEEKARDFAARFGKRLELHHRDLSPFWDDLASVQECELDPEEPAKVPFWDVHFDKDGTVEFARACDPEEDSDESISTGPRGHVYVCVEAENEEAAIKIASERRAQFLVAR